MAETSRAGTASHYPTRGETSIQEFVNTEFTPQLLRQRASQLLNSEQLLQNVLGLTLDDQTKIVEKVDEIYPTVDSQNVKFVTVLGNVCSAIRRLPTSAVLSEGLKKQGQICVASGPFTDIWRGEHHGAQVAIKAFRTYPTQVLEPAKEILWKRVPMWRRLSHENILPFRGVDTTLFQLALVYDWEQHGNINQYIALHPEAPRPHLLFDVAKGLKYLHSLGIPHGNLKGVNVIIDQSGHARLTEYGLVPIEDAPGFASTTLGAVRSARWLAPEIIDPPTKSSGMTEVESKPADVFAFAMLVVEVFTGRVPFENQGDVAAAVSILKGSRPEMPEYAQEVGLITKMWELLESCWQEDPKRRPTMEEVVGRWQEFVGRDNDGNEVTEKPPTVERAPGISRLWARTETVRPQTKPEVPRLRTISGTAHPRTNPEVTLRQRMFEAIPPRLLIRLPWQELTELEQGGGRTTQVNKSNTGHGLPVGDGQRIPDPCVDGPPDVPIFTAGRPKEIDRTASLSLLKRFTDACRTAFPDIRSVNLLDHACDGRTPAQPPEKDRNIEPKKRNPLLRALRSFCCCQCICY